MDHKSQPMQQPVQQSMQRYDQQPPMPQPAQYQQANTTVVINQPYSNQNQLRLTDIHGHREWTTGLFDCCSDVGNCFFVWCCYCCAVSKINSRLGENCCTTCCVPCVEINFRTRIRTMGGIRGSICNDCMTIWCCDLCATCQELREIDAMGL